MPDTTYGAKSAATPDTHFRVQDQGAAGKVPYHIEDTAQRAALIDALTALKELLQGVVDLGATATALNQITLNEQIGAISEEVWDYIQASGLRGILAAMAKADKEFYDNAGPAEILPPPATLYRDDALVAKVLVAAGSGDVAFISLGSGLAAGGALTWVHAFDAATAAEVVVGTTEPLASWPVPAGGGNNPPVPGLTVEAGLVLVATTSPLTAVTTAPAAGAIVSLGHRIS